MLTSKTYLIRAVLVFLFILFCVRQASINWSENIQFLFIALLMLAIFLFYLNCLDIWLYNKTELKLFRFGREIIYKNILKMGALPIFSKGFGTTYTIYYIDYLNQDDQKKRKFFYISYKNNQFADTIKEIISKSNT